MHTVTTLDVQEAWAWVEREFPFAGYLSEGTRRGLEHVVQAVARHLSAEGVPKLLDMGCGPMDKTAVFQKLGFECYGVDDLCDPWHLDDDNQNKIRNFAEKAGIRFYLHSLEDHSVPFPEDYFDVTTILDVVEHLHQSPQGILNVAGRHLKVGGVLCITMPNSVNLRKRLDVMRGNTNYPPVDQFYWWMGPWRGHVREYTLAEAVQICRTARFYVLSATTCEGIAYNQLRGFALYLFLGLSHFFPTFRSQLCVIARKPAEWMPQQPDADRFRKSSDPRTRGPIT